jgi:hypothetical protein
MAIKGITNSSFISGFKEHGLKFFSLFVPAGCPLGLLPLFVIIETILYLVSSIYNLITKYYLLICKATPFLFLLIVYSLFFVGRIILCEP